MRSFRNSRTWCLIAAAILSLTACPAQVVLSSGFPGQGSSAAWGDALPYYNRGNRYLNQGRFADAASDYREAISRYPYDPDFYINLGVACRKLDDYVGAEQAFKAALELNEKDWSAWMDLGNAYLKQNRLQDTLHAFERSLKCNPPAADRAVLVQNIADIHKVLRNLGQEPMPVAGGDTKKSGSKNAATKRATAAKIPAKAPAVKGNSAPVSGPAPRSLPAAPSAPAKDWGYD